MEAAAQETKLLAAIATQNALLTAVRDKKHPDFAFLHGRDVLLQQAQCWLALARTRRLTAARSAFAGSSHDISASFQLQPTPLDETLLGGAVECLTNARRIYFDGDMTSSKSAAHGLVLVLIEEAELLVLRGEHADALTTYDNAIQLAGAQGDHATESLVRHKRETLALDVATWAKLDQVARSPLESVGEREILQKCFDQLTLAGGGVLRRDQFAAFARDLGAQVALTEDEVDEIWRQIEAHRGTTPKTPQEADGVTFDALWRWWVIEEMYEFQSQQARRR